MTPKLKTNVYLAALALSSTANSMVQVLAAPYEDHQQNAKAAKKADSNHGNVQTNKSTRGVFPGSGATLDDLIPSIKVESLDKNEGKISLSALSAHEQSSSVEALHSEYAKEFQSLDLEQVKAEIRALLTESKDFWPADYGHYGPLMIRMAWHSAGTYRATDGRGGSDGGQQRFYPLANWPDNANLDKARRLIRPIVEKYYPKLSWADAMILAGDIAMQDMGFKTLGVAGGRIDDREPDLVYWGPEDAFLKSERFDKKGNLQLPLAASAMGLIYVNPEGPDGKPDPLLAAGHIRTTFGRMGMNDEETVALIAGGHAFGKAHGIPKPKSCKGDPNCKETKGPFTNTSGLEGSWTSTPAKWTNQYLTNLFKYDWKLQRGPGGKYQWYAADLQKEDMAPDAHDPSKLVPIMMLTTDLSLKYDPAYRAISQRFLDNPAEFDSAFAAAWFKLIHRDLGPKSRYLGNDFPKDDFLFQDPIPEVDHKLVESSDINELRSHILSSSLSTADGVKTAWAAAASFRGSDLRGGVNGGRIRLQPQISWEANEPELLSKNLSILKDIQRKFNEKSGSNRGIKISLADLIVLAGNTFVEEAAKKAGISIKIPFIPGRTDATQEQTEIASFNSLKVTADGFRNFYNPKESYLNPEAAFVDKADQLRLTKQEMAALTGGLRVLGGNFQDSELGRLTKTPGVLTNDFFVNLLSQSTVWKKSQDQKGVFIGTNKQTNEKLWVATSQDLVFGLNPELRLVSYSYATVNAKQKFATDFAKAWTKVMSLDRFDIAKKRTMEPK